jgi:addiction module RelE/StbE family toxin
VPTPPFTRALKRLLKKHPELDDGIQGVLQLLSENIAHPQLGTHKLKGQLAGLMSCSAGYDLRIVFEVIKEADEEKIALYSIGTHDEVY